MEHKRLKIYVENVDFAKKGFIFGAKCDILYTDAGKEAYMACIDLLSELTLERI